MQSHRAMASASSSSVVSAWLTTADGKARLAHQPDLRWGPEGPYTPLTIWVNDAQRYQHVRGFGASMTDTSAQLLYHALPAASRATVMRALFSPIQGIGLSFLRQPMGASDYTYDGVPYTYDDLPPGQSDPQLLHFSVHRDDSAIVPALRDALRLNPRISIIANPWSPPAWMRRDGKTIGSLDPNPLRPEDYVPLAHYFVRFIQAYQARGIPIEAVGPQNEPGYGNPDYPAMFLPGTAEVILIKDMATALQAAGLHTRILAYDWVWGSEDSNLEYPFAVLQDATAGPLIAGISYHCYFGEPDAMTELHLAFPTRELDETECSDSLPTHPFSAARPPIEMVINAMRNWASTVGIWNIAVAASGGPAIGHGCASCIGLVTVNRRKKTVSYTRDYYQLGHASKFVMTGAVRVGSNTFGSSAYNDPSAATTRSLEDVAFQNPDGSHVLIAENAARSPARFKVRWGAQAFFYQLPPGAIVTFVWRGAISPHPALPAQPSGPVYYAIDAGGAGAGRIMPDAFYDGGRGLRINARVEPAQGDSFGPDLYQTQRIGLIPWQYTFPALQPGALYGVRLHFAELEFTRPGQREFDIFVNGVLVAHNFDIVQAAGGRDRGIVVSVLARAQPNGTIDIGFGPGTASNPTVNGIEIVAPSLLHANSASPDRIIEGERWSSAR